MDDVVRLFRLYAMREPTRGAVIALWDRDRMFVPETAPIYPYLVRARVGVFVAWTPLSTDGLKS